jgi:hypothetical protein
VIFKENIFLFYSSPNVQEYRQECVAASFLTLQELDNILHMKVKNTKMNPKRAQDNSSHVGSYTPSVERLDSRKSMQNVAIQKIDLKRDFAFAKIL